ncbi:tetratricopeptide repeat protein [Streptomyces sp. S399]|uniref:tetratricopeptide repeat protein n=1 Tax=Streptomyces sp. S399 TaxID=3096009 RepID=UPI0039C09726
MDSAAVIGERGEIHRRAGEYAEALAAFDAAVAADPDYLWAYGSRALAHHALGDFTAAVADLRHALARKPDYLWARLRLAEFRHEQGDCDAEFAEYDEAVTATTGRLARPYVLRGRAHAEHGRFCAGAGGRGGGTADRAGGRAGPRTGRAMECPGVPGDAAPQPPSRGGARLRGGTAAPARAREGPRPRARGAKGARPLPCGKGSHPCKLRHQDDGSHTAVRPRPLTSGQLQCGTRRKRNGRTGGALWARPSGPSGGGPSSRTSGAGCAGRCSARPWGTPSARR